MNFLQKIITYTLISIFAVVNLPVTSFADTGSAVSSSSPGVDDLEKELADLESRLQQHLKKADEASFWSTDNTIQPAFSGGSALRNVVPKDLPEGSVRKRGTKITPKRMTTPPYKKGQKSPNFQSIQDQLDQREEEIASRVKVSGTYRMAMGVGRNRTFSVNDSNSDLSDRDFHHLFGVRRENTYDPAIYSQYLLDINADMTENSRFYAQMVADPWSYVGHTSETDLPDALQTDILHFQHKYWGSNGSTLSQNFRTVNRDIVSIAEMEDESGFSGLQSTRGLNFGGFQRTFNLPELDIDYEFRPLRKMWVDFEEPSWNLRLFALADQTQVMTTDDPLGLSNRKDFWQNSRWLDSWRPQWVFIDNDVGRSIRRGYYDDEEAFAAKDSEGNFLTFLRGAAFETTQGDTYIGAMVASPYGLWDRYFELDNVPGVVRMKHKINSHWTVGSLYGFRVAMIDREPDAYNGVIAADTELFINDTDYFYGQIAGSRTDVDQLSIFPSSYEGRAYKGGFVINVPSGSQTLTQIHGDFSWMDTKFNTELSDYSKLRDDEFWGNHISFARVPYDVEPFKIGTGLDRGRYVARISIDMNAPEKGVDTFFDMRHVRDAEDDSFIEHVIRSETDVEITPHLRLKTFGRFHILPKTLSDTDPFLAFHTEPLQRQGVFTPDPALMNDIDLQNVDIDQGLDANQKSLGIGLEFQPREQWKFQGSVTRTNAIPDFPRNLQNNYFLQRSWEDPEHPGVYLDRIQPFLYGQHVYGLPPYDFFSIYKERIIYEPYSNLRFIFHAAQNSYLLWAPIDENVNHEGISVDYQINKRWAFFMDYSHSRIVDVPRLIDTGYQEFNYESHHNIYGILTYKLHAHAVLNFEYGVFGKTFYEGSDAVPSTPYAVTNFGLQTVDTEHLFRMSLDGQF